jgi:tellurite resistance protein TehA-like permease
MDTGVLGIFLHNFPFPSQWTHICSIIIFVFELVLFLLFGTVSLLRWLLFFRSTLRHLKRDSEEIALQACPAITWLMLAAQIQLICAEQWGFGFTILAYAMWWVGLVWVIFISVILYLHLIRKPHRAFVDKWLPTAIFIPLVGALTVGDVAGVMINSSGPSQVDQTLAIPMVIVGFMCVGFALGLSCVMYAIYMHRLMVSGWPSALKIPSMILTVRTTFHSHYVLSN